MNMDQRAFSLIELIVIMGIMTILLSIATLSFNQWSRKAAIEAQTRVLLSDLTGARLEAVSGKQRRSIVLNPDSYSLKNYSSADESSTGGGTIVYTKILKYPIASMSGVFSGNHVVFNTRGFVEIPPYPTIRTIPSYSGAAFDCIVISAARNNIGKVEKVSGNDKCLPK